MTQQQARQIEDVHGSGIYPATGPLPPGDAIVRTAGALGHPEQRPTSRVQPQAIERPAFLGGRAIFGGYFLYNGINHYVNYRMLTEYARSKGVPAPGVAVAGSGLLLITGGLSLITGLFPKIGAGLISTFLLGVSPQMHGFWREKDPERTNDMVNFVKNMALLGGSLLAAGHPEPWPHALGHRTGQMVAGTTTG